MLRIGWYKQARDLGTNQPKVAMTRLSLGTKGNDWIPEKA